MTRLPTLACLALPVLLSGWFTSCGRDEDPGIREKVDLLEAEIRDRDSQIAALHDEANSTPETTTNPSIGTPDLKAARGTYLGFVETVRGRLADGLPGARFDRTSIFPVEGPDPARPIISKVSFRIVGRDGRAGEMAIPLFADRSGKWETPDTAEIVASFGKKAAEAPPVAVAPPAPKQVHPQEPSEPTDVMGASRTVEVKWPEDQKPAPPHAKPPVSQATTQPQPQPKQALPRKVMPAERDVIIDFE